MNGWRSAIGWARKAPGARISKIRSVRAHPPASRSPTLPAMENPPYGPSEHCQEVYVGMGPTATESAGPQSGHLKQRLRVDPRQSTLGVPRGGLPHAPRLGPTTMRYRAYAYTSETDRRTRLEEDVRRGLTASPKTLPSKYFYDVLGSNLLENITKLPEYYLTRTEAALLDTLAPRLMRELEPQDIVELGPGSASKPRRLFDGRNGLPGPLRYVPIDVDELTVQASAARLISDYPFLDVRALVGDFEW